MKKSFLLLSASLLMTLSVMAQLPELAGVSQNFSNAPYYLPGSQAIDTTLFVVRYQFAYPRASGSKLVSQNDVLQFEIGKRISKTYSYNLYLLERNRTYKEKNQVKYSMYYVPYTVYGNYPSGQITEENRVPNSVMLQGAVQMISYTEPVPSMEWQLSEETDTIAGYVCQVAQCRFRGRNWKVWFTPEIPVAMNVWKFHGLPGLILRAADTTGSYKFEALEIKNEQVPILRYDYKAETKSRAAWRKLETDFYKHPANYFSQGGKLMIMGESGKKIEPDNWTLPYDPIEIE